MTSRAYAVTQGQNVVYDFPLRPDLMVRFVLPADLTTGEAERLIRFVQTLPFPDES